MPGIGPYTAAAISAIAFGRAEPVVDGNIERVSTRYTANATPLPAVKEDCRTFMKEVTPDDRPGDFVQAMMDLGATICTPRSPACALCPINDGCAAYATGSAADFPVKAPKKKKPTRLGAAFVLQRNDGAIWLTKRPNSGLLGGMSVVPTTNWTSRQDGETSTKAAPVPGDWKECGTVRHTFTHFHLELTVWHNQSASPATDVPGNGWWSAPRQVAGEALPTVMKKAISAAIRDAFKESA